MFPLRCRGHIPFLSLAVRHREQDTPLRSGTPVVNSADWGNFPNRLNLFLVEYLFLLENVLDEPDCIRYNQYG